MVRTQDRSAQPSLVEELHQALRREVRPYLPVLAQCSSTRELERHPVYQRLRPLISRVLDTPEVGHFGPERPPFKMAYRFVAWNLERGIRLEGQLHALRTHPYLREADVLLLPETDVGMARSGNRNVAAVLARELGYHYVFGACYLNLTKGAGEEREAPGENELGLHGNALLSRYPIGKVELVRLANGIDKMARREKRIGSQVAVVAEIRFPQRPLLAVVVHLDANSTQRHRKAQMATVLRALPPRGPVVLGGDWNTTTFDSSTAFRAIMGYWLRVFMGPGRVIQRHFLHPYRWFERGLFRLLERHGFDFRRSNVLGDYTMYYEFDNPRTYKGLAEWVPGWCFPFIRWALSRYGGRCPLRLDWFATRELEVENPVVIHDARLGGGPALSDHEPIGLEVVLGGANRDTAAK